MPQDSCFLNLEDLHKYFRFLHAKGFPAVSSYLLQWSLHSRKACPAGQIHKGSECLCRSHIVLNLKIRKYHLLNRGSDWWLGSLLRSRKNQIYSWRHVCSDVRFQEGWHSVDSYSGSRNPSWSVQFPRFPGGCWRADLPEYFGCWPFGCADLISAEQ